MGRRSGEKSSSCIKLGELRPISILGGTTQSIALGLKVKPGVVPKHLSKSGKRDLFPKISNKKEELGRRRRKKD